MRVGVKKIIPKDFTPKQIVWFFDRGNDDASRRPRGGHIEDLVDMIKGKYEMSN